MGPRTTAPLSSRRTFEELGAAGRRGTSGLFKVRFLADADDHGVARVAYSVPRRCGSAVARNRIRRRVRAALALLQAELCPGAYLIAPNPTVRTAPFADVLAALRAALLGAGALGTAP